MKMNKLEHLNSAVSSYIYFYHFLFKTDTLMSLMQRDLWTLDNSTCVYKGCLLLTFNFVQQQSGARKQEAGPMTIDSKA